MKADLKETLEELYTRLNRREFAKNDPIGFLYSYDDLCDREVAGLVASSLAYGGIRQILRSVSCILETLGPSPSRFIEKSTKKSLEKSFAGFKHRWTTGRDISCLLFGAKRTMEKYGSFHARFTACLDKNEDTIIPALINFTNELAVECQGMRKGLLPSPANGSACKRINLFLRWMVRQDDVDPGGWDHVPASRLIMPLDTHTYNIGLALNFTKRNQPDLISACEITEAFREISPHDPVRYDFSLAHIGMQGEAAMKEFLEKCKGAEAVHHA